MLQPYIESATALSDNTKKHLLVNEKRRCSKQTRTNAHLTAPEFG